MSDQPEQGKGVVGKLTGAAALVTGGATVAGIAQGHEWAGVAKEVGLPTLLLLLVVWGVIRVCSWAGPHVLAAFNEFRAFVRSVAENDGKHTAQNAQLVEIQAQQVRIQEKQAASIEHLHGCVEALKEGIGVVAHEAKETNRLLRAASQTPQPPHRP